MRAIPTKDVTAGLDAQTADLLARLAAMAGEDPPPMEKTRIDAARAATRAIFLSFAGEEPCGVTVEALLVPGGAGAIPARLYRPTTGTSDTARPLIVFLHGGGWAMGDLDSYDGLMRSLSQRSGAAILGLEYRLAPEYPFPAGLEDGLAAVQWASRRARALGGDPSRLAVMGDSAGGNLAAAIAQTLSRDRNGPLAAQFLIYPVLDVSRPHAAYPSRMRFGDGDLLLTRESIDATTRWYLQENGAADAPQVSPLRGDRLEGLPPTVIVTAGFDPLRDEATAYADTLRRAGVHVEHRCFESTIHAFVSFGVLDVAQHARQYLAEKIKNLLGGEPA